jgi:hypothetical protein
LIIEKRKTMIASKDNKHKYADDTEEEAEEVALKKQRMIGDDNGDDDDDSSSSSTDDFSSESEEEVSSEEDEINLSTGSEEKLLIRWVGSDDGDTSESENNGSIRYGENTSDDGDTFNNEEEQFLDDGSTFD